MNSYRTTPNIRKYRKRSFLLFLLVSAYVLILLALACLPFWPRPIWAFATIFNFAPHWFYIVPALVFAPLCWMTRQFGLMAMLFGAALLCLKLSGWVFNISAPPVNTTETTTLSRESLVVITANMGYANYEKLNQLIVENNADLIALQETTVQQIAPLLEMSPLNSVCKGDLCLLSHFNLKLIDTRRGTFLNPPSDFIMQVEVSLPPSDTQSTLKTFDFFVLHTITPRGGFGALVTNPFTGWSGLFNTVDTQATEAWMASTFVKQGHNVLVAGDFNLPRDNPIFAQYWSWLNDSFEESGSGFGYSKHTRVHGVTIDHLLHDHNWVSQKTWIGNSLDGDHSPLISILNQQH